jgi:hypothetical protein
VWDGTAGFAVNLCTGGPTAVEGPQPLAIRFDRLTATMKRLMIQSCIGFLIELKNIELDVTCFRYILPHLPRRNKSEKGISKQKFLNEDVNNGVWQAVQTMILLHELIFY